MQQAKGTPDCPTRYIAVYAVPADSQQHTVNMAHDQTLACNHVRNKPVGRCIAAVHVSDMHMVKQSARTCLVQNVYLSAR